MECCVTLYSATELFCSLAVETRLGAPQWSTSVNQFRGISIVRLYRWLGMHSSPLPFLATADPVLWYKSHFGPARLSRRRKSGEREGNEVVVDLSKEVSCALQVVFDSLCNCARLLGLLSREELRSFAFRSRPRGCRQLKTACFLIRTPLQLIHRGNSLSPLSQAGPPLADADPLETLKLARGIAELVRLPSSSLRTARRPSRPRYTLQSALFVLDVSSGPSRPSHEVPSPKRSAPTSTSYCSLRPSLCLDAGSQNTLP